MHNNKKIVKSAKSKISYFGWLPLTTGYTADEAKRETRCLHSHRQCRDSFESI